MVNSCVSRFKIYCDDHLKGNPECDAVATFMKNGTDKDADFINKKKTSLNCAEETVYSEGHGNSASCDPYFNLVKLCVSCDKGACTKYNFNNYACSVLQNEKQVIEDVDKIKAALKAAGDTQTEITVTANQTVSSPTACYNSEEIFSITGGAVKTQYPLCSNIENKNCYGRVSEQARYESAKCADSSGNVKNVDVLSA